MAKLIVWTEQAKADVCGIEQPIASRPLSGSVPRNYRIFFRDKGDYLEISRVLDRKEAYR